jgi:predicted transcriptional regulator
MTQNTPEIGAKIRQMREAAGISQAELAKLADLHWNAVARIERGEVHPSFAAVVALLGGMGHKFEVADKGAAK